MGAGLIFAFCLTLPALIENVDGRCSYGFPSSYAVDCSIWTDIMRNLGWYPFNLFVVGIYWLPGTFVITIGYWLYLSYRKNQQLPTPERHYKVFTLLGILCGVVLVMFLPILIHFPDESFLIRSLILLGVPIIIGVLIDRYRNPQNAES